VCGDCLFRIDPGKRCPRPHLVTGIGEDLLNPASTGNRELDLRGCGYLAKVIPVLHETTPFDRNYPYPDCLVNVRFHPRGLGPARREENQHGRQESDECATWRASVHWTALLRRNSELSSHIVWN
jgi:hypothetical protein